MTTGSSQNHTRSLSRWHLIATRINGVADTRQREAIEALNNTSLQHAPTEAQKEALAARGKQALAMVEESLQAREVVGNIRSALAQKNAETGVSQLLAEIEAMRKKASLLRNVAGIDVLTRVGLDEAGVALEKRNTSERPGYPGLVRQSGGVQVALVSHQDLDPFRERLAQVEAEINKLTDKVNDMNRAQLTLSIPDAFAATAGLAG